VRDLLREAWRGAVAALWARPVLPRVRKAGAQVSLVSGLHDIVAGWQDPVHLRHPNLGLNRRTLFIIKPEPPQREMRPRGREVVSRLQRGIRHSELPSI